MQKAKDFMKCSQPFVPSVFSLLCRVAVSNAQLLINQEVKLLRIRREGSLLS